MTQTCYTYHIRITNDNDVQVSAYIPSQELLGEPRGDFGYKGKRKTRIRALHQAARDGALDGASVQELGEALFAALFDAGLSRDFFGLYERARQEDALLRIELDVDERQLPEIAALPWEFARTPAQSGYGNLWLSTTPGLVFSRRRTRWLAADPIHLKAGERLRIALAVAATEDLGPVKHDKVWDALKKLSAEQPERVELLALVEQATPAAIDALLERKPHIFHFIGHARLQDETRQPAGQIALVDDIQCGAVWISDERFSELFNRHQPGVVLLQACEGAALSASQAFVGVASQVIQQNIAVVVAMQYPVSNNTANRFALEFYRRLSQGDPVDKAAQEGRRRIALEPAGYTSRDFATPVLFMRVRDGWLFRRDDDNNTLDQAGKATSLIHQSPGEPPASTQYKAETLQEQLAGLIADYQAANRQLGMSLSEVERSRLKRTMTSMEQEIQQAQSELDALTLTRDTHTPTQPPPASIDRTRLYEILTASFSDIELKELCFRLDIDYEGLPDQGRSGKARELILYCERHTCTPELIGLAYRMRPKAGWW